MQFASSVYESVLSGPVFGGPLPMDHEDAVDQVFSLALSPLLKFKVEVTADSLSWKLGVRPKATVRLDDIAYFGHRRLPDGANNIVEVVFVPKAAGTKLPKLPVNPADPGTQVLLAFLAGRLPEADTARLPWLEAAPLLGMKPYGLGAYLRYPLFGLGLALLLLGGPASYICQRFFGMEARLMGPVVGVIMVLGIGMMFVGWRRVKADQRAEEDAAKRRKVSGGGPS